MSDTSSMCGRDTCGGDSRGGDSRCGGALEAAWRDERATVLAGLARRLGDLELAEDAVQEAFATAAARWPVDGVPDRPGAWLTTTAWRKALDLLRRVRPRGDAPEPTVQDPRLGGEPADATMPDDMLALVLTCCHPALAPEAQVALTLRHVAGLTAREIATAFLLPEATLAKRLVRARAKIRDARISFAPPDRAGLPDRLEAARAVIYLVFNEGYLASGDGPPVRAALCTEAVWLAGRLHRALPADPETTGLLALLLLHDARRAARQGGGDGLLPYAEQDRTRWDHGAIDRAKVLLSTTGATPPGPYQVQAAIALLHATGAPDWVVIARLYGVLARLAPSPVVTVNRAAAVGRADGARSGLAMLAPALADRRLARYLPLHAAHADLLDRAGEPGATAAWLRPAGLAPSGPQRDRLLARVPAGRIRGEP